MQLPILQYYWILVLKLFNLYYDATIGRLSGHILLYWRVYGTNVQDASAAKADCFRVKAVGLAIVYVADHRS
jgi:hypothetical protein